MAFILMNDQWTVRMGGSRYGMSEVTSYDPTAGVHTRTTIEFGPLGEVTVPVAATTSLLIILAAVITAPLGYYVLRAGMRRKRLS